MDFLNRALEQLSDLFASMTPAARITTALLLAVVVISLAFLFNSEFSAGEAYLMGGRPFQADEISAAEAAFGQAGLTGHVVEGSRIVVPRGQQTVYMAALAEADALPPDFGDYLWKAANQSSPFTSQKMNDVRIQAAREQDLANIIRGFTGISNAAVTYDKTTRPGIRRNAIATASVSVKPVGSQELDPAVARSIRNLVVGSIAELTRENVTVIDLNSGTSFGGGSTDGSPSVDEDLYLAKLKAAREEVEAKVRKAVSHIRGAIVVAHVELNKELDHEKSTITYDDKNKATVFTQTDEASNTESRPVSQGRPGLASQQPAGGNTSASLAAAEASTAQNEESKTNSRSQSLPSTDTERIEYAGLTPKLATVSVEIPRSHYVSVWRERNPTPEGEETAAPSDTDLQTIQTDVERQVTETVANLMRDGTEVDPTSLVKVTSFTDIAPEQIPEPAFTSTASNWLAANWTTLGLFGLAGVSLLVLRATVRANPGGPEPNLPDIALAPGTSPVDADEEQTAKKPPAEPRLKRPTGDGAGLTEELTELVREDPDAAASVLRNWIAKAS